MVVNDIQDDITIKSRLVEMFHDTIKRQEGGLPIKFCKEYLDLMDDIEANVRRIEDQMLSESNI